MNSIISKRVLLEAKYMLDTNQTLRETAKVFSVSKSTVHKDLKDRLILVDKDLYSKIIKILNYHKEIRHIRGGESTKLKYQKHGYEKTLKF